MANGGGLSGVLGNIADTIAPNLSKQVTAAKAARAQLPLIEAQTAGKLGQQHDISSLFGGLDPLSKGADGSPIYWNSGRPDMPAPPMPKNDVAASVTSIPAPPTNPMQNFMQTMGRLDPEFAIKTQQGVMGRQIDEDLINRLPIPDDQKNMMRMSITPGGAKLSESLSKNLEIPDSVRSLNYYRAQVGKYGAGTPEAKPYEDAISTANAAGANAAESKRNNDIQAQQNRYKFEKDAMGNIQPFDTTTAKFVDPKSIGLPDNMNEENAASTAKQIYEYRKKPLSGFVLKSPYGQMVQDEINKLDSDGQKGGEAPYNEQYYVTSQKARNDFATGQQGNSVRSYNVWSHHLMMLKELGKALDTGNSQTANKIQQAFQEEFNNPNLSSYETIAPLVGEEGAKAVLGGRSTGPEREEFLKPFRATRNNASRNANIDTMIGAAGAQLRGLKQQYKTSVRAKDFDAMLFPEVAQMFGADAPSNSAAPVPQVGAPAKITADAAGQQAWEKLPPGTPYIDPNGVPRTKK